MNLGDKIIKIRKENKMSQDNFAELLNVTRQTVSNWENSKNYPDIETLIKISDKFHISLDILLKGDKDMIKNIDDKLKYNKIFKIVIIILICIIILVPLGDFIYHKFVYYRNINNPSPNYITTKCILNDKKVELSVKVPYSKDKKWYEPPTYDAMKSKPEQFKVTDITDYTNKIIDEEIMSQMNFNINDYSNCFDLLEDMEKFIINLGGACN